MKLRPLPAGTGLPGVTGLIDSLQRTLFDLDDSVTRYELPFKQLLGDWLKGRLHNLRAPARLLLAIAFTSGLASPDRLLQMLQSLDCVIRTSAGDWVHWTDDDWPHACLLSEFTVVAYGNLERPIHWQLELDLFDQWLIGESAFGLLVLPRGNRRAIQALMRGALAYWHATLPGAVSAHIAECQMLAPLSRETLAREVGKMALARRIDRSESDALTAARSTLDEASFRASVAIGSSMTNPAAARLWPIMRPAAQGGYATDRNSRLGRIAEVFEDIDPMDVDGNLRVAFCLFMFSVGTPGAKRPSMVTCGRHYRAIDKIARSLPGGLAEFVGLPDEQKVEHYMRWLEGDPADPFLKAAIGAFHMFLVEQLGAAPVWVRGKSITIKVPPLASVVWIHERERALEGIERSGLSARGKLMARALLLLACDVPLRISDVRRMKWRDVRKVGSRVFLDIAQPRDAASAKNTHTFRTVSIDAKSAHDAIAAWMQQREEDESAEPTEWLFGDGFEAMEQTELAQVYSVICSLLKAVTGDPTVSFHTLRHTCISELILDAFLNAPDDKEWDPLEPVASRAGHASAYTSLTVYFHLLPIVQRRLIDRHLKSKMTTRLVARTCGVKENTLTQRKKRRHEADELGNVLAAAARAVMVASADSVVALCAPDLQSIGAKRLRVVDILKIISALDETKDLTATAKRSGLSLDRIRDISRLRNRVQMVYPGAIRRKAWKHSAKVQRVLRQVDRSVDSAETRQALGSWLHAMDKGYVSVTNLRAVEPLLRMFQQLGTSHANLVLRVADEDSPDVGAIESLFVTVFGHAPVLEHADLRGDRTANYIQIDGHAVDVGKVASSASLAMRGLHAVFTSLFVWHALAGTELPGAVE